MRCCRIRWECTWGWCPDNENWISILVDLYMPQLFALPGSLTRDPAVDRWMDEHATELGAIARHWFNVIRSCGEDVRETLHDGQPTACVGGVAFAYVDAFKTHVNVGFFRGAGIADPDHLMELSLIHI